MPRLGTYVMNIRPRRWTQALLLASGIVALSGYTISPRKKVHEWMTSAAYLCYQQAVESARKPLDCRWPHRNDVLPEKIAWFGGATQPEDWRSYPNPLALLKRVKFRFKFSPAWMDGSHLPLEIVLFRSWCVRT